MVKSKGKRRRRRRTQGQLSVDRLFVVLQHPPSSHYSSYFFLCEDRHSSQRTVLSNFSLQKNFPTSKQISQRRQRIYSFSERVGRRLFAAHHGELKATRRPNQYDDDDNDYDDDHDHDHDDDDDDDDDDVVVVLMMMMKKKKMMMMMMVMMTMMMMMMIRAVNATATTKRSTTTTTAICPLTAFLYRLMQNTTVHIKYPFASTREGFMSTGSVTDEKSDNVKRLSATVVVRLS